MTSGLFQWAHGYQVTFSPEVSWCSILRIRFPLQKWRHFEDPNTPLRFKQVHSPLHWRVLHDSLGTNYLPNFCTWWLTWDCACNWLGSWMITDPFFRGLFSTNLNGVKLVVRTQLSNYMTSYQLPWASKYGMVDSWLLLSEDRVEGCCPPKKNSKCSWKKGRAYLKNPIFQPLIYL